MHYPSSVTQLGVVCLLTAVWVLSQSATVSVKANGSGRVLAGGAAILVCVTSDPSGTKPVITKWTKGPSEALPSDSNSKRLIFGDSKKELTIINLKKSDEGWYYCHADTASGDISNRTYLYVIVPPTITSVHSETVQENRNATLGCFGVDFFIVHWSFRGVPLTGARYPKSGKMSKNMTIVQTRRSDSGTYECEMVNEKYRKSAFPTLIVEYPPEVLQGPEDLHVLPNVGFDARFRCNVTGEPRPAVTWTRDDMNLNFSRDYRLALEEANGVHTLTIEKAKKSDSGIYACEVSNKYGRVSASAKLIVGIVDLPTPPPAFKTIEYGQNDMLEARAGGLDDPVIEWQKDGQALGYTKNPRLSKTKDGNLKISNAQYEDSGKYVWTATSASHRIEQFITVVVRGPPAAPEGVSVKINTTSVVSTIVSWTASAFDGNSAITGYAIKCRRIGELAWRLMHVSPEQRSVTMDCVNLPGKYDVVVEVTNKRGSSPSNHSIFIYEPVATVSATPTTDSPSTGDTSTNSTTAMTTTPQLKVAREGETSNSSIVVVSVVLSTTVLVLIVLIAVIVTRRLRKQGHMTMNRDVKSAEVPPVISSDIVPGPCHGNVHVDTKTENRSPFPKRRPSSLSTRPLLESSSSVSESVQLSTPTPSSQDCNAQITILVNSRTYSTSASMDSPSQSSRCDMEIIKEVGAIRLETQVSLVSEQSDEVLGVGSLSQSSRVDKETVKEVRDKQVSQVSEQSDDIFGMDSPSQSSHVDKETVTEVRDIGLEKQVSQVSEQSDDVFGMDSLSQSNRVDKETVEEVRNIGFEKQVSHVSELSDEVFSPDGPGQSSRGDDKTNCKKVKDSGYETQLSQVSDQGDEVFAGNFGELYKTLYNVEKRMRSRSESDSESQSAKSPQGVPV